MADTPLLPKPTPVGLPSSNPLFRALDILTGGIAGAVTGDNVKRRVRDEQLQNAIEAQAREEAIRQQIMANRRNDAEGLGLDPMSATAAQIEAARQAKQLGFERKRREQDNELELGSKARQLGLDPAAQPAMGGPVNPFASPNVKSAMQVGQPKPLEQQIAEAESSKRLSQYKQERDLTADAQIRANEAKESMALKNIKAEAMARNIDPESPAGKKFMAFRMKLSAMPADAKYAALTVQDMVKTGLVKDDPDAIEREEARLLPFGGKTPTLTPAMEKSVADESNLVLNLGSVQNAITAFEQKYGPGSFDRYVGPIDNRTNEWKLQISKDSASPADLEAKRIAQLFQTTFNADLKATSGGAVTESEAVRKIREAGSLDGASFKNSLQGWREARVMGLKNKERVLGGFAVPKGLFNYGEDMAAAGPVAPVPAITDYAAAAKAERARRAAKGGN